MKMTTSLKLRSSPGLHIFQCPCPKFSFHTLTPFTHNRSTSASIFAILLAVDVKHQVTFTLKGVPVKLAMQKYRQRFSDSSFTDPPNPKSVDSLNCQKGAKSWCSLLFSLTLFLKAPICSLPSSLLQLYAHESSWPHFSFSESGHLRFGRARMN